MTKKRTDGQLSGSGVNRTNDCRSAWMDDVSGAWGEDILPAIVGIQSFADSAFDRDTARRGACIMAGNTAMRGVIDRQI